MGHQVIVIIVILGYDNNFEFGLDINCHMS